ncbi:hypothetical protein ACFWHT_07285 [Microbacterium sp. NPDC058342]|uniref:hypothetical protein n=1 Tax=Microbacterium sp. NPDC058342 TaxID=3346454 RepID=UPI00364C0F10
MLERRFRAYEVPVDLVPRSDYEMDDDVVEEDVWKLYVITDKAVLDGLISPDAFELDSWPPPPGSDETFSADDLPEVLGNLHGDLLPSQEVGFRLLTRLISLGAALGALLESRDGNVVDGFKVYGPSDKLTEVLIGHIGWEKYRRTESHPDGVAVGDIEDEDFARYLQMAYAEGKLILKDQERG